MLNTEHGRRRSPKQSAKVARANLLCSNTKTSDISVSVTTKRSSLHEEHSSTLREQEASPGCDREVGDQ